MRGESLSEENSVLVRAIKLRKSLETSGLKLTKTLQNKVCSELQGYCEEADFPDDEDPSAVGDSDDDDDDDDDDDEDEDEEKNDGEDSDEEKKEL